MSAAPTRRPRLRPETLAFAQGGRNRPVTAASLIEMPLEDELLFTRVMATRLLRALRQRHPQFAAELLADMEPTARALVDRVFEAMLLLLTRHGLRVEPCRKLLWAQDSEACRYSVEQPDGTWRIVDEADLLALAGLTA